MKKWPSPVLYHLYYAFSFISCVPSCFGHAKDLQKPTATAWVNGSKTFTSSLEPAEDALLALFLGTCQELTN